VIVASPEVSLIGTDVVSTVLHVFDEARARGEELLTVPALRARLPKEVTQKQMHMALCELFAKRRAVFSHEHQWKLTGQRQAKIPATPN
jgi:hypothetical protein